MPKCLKCGRETPVEGQICAECAKKIEEELSRRGVSRDLGKIASKETNTREKPQEERGSFKSKVVMWLLILIIFGIAIGLILYFYLGILKDRI